MHTHTQAKRLSARAAKVAKFDTVARGHKDKREKLRAEGTSLRACVRTCVCALCTVGVCVGKCMCAHYY
jgi:hypothetical protein